VKIFPWFFEYNMENAQQFTYYFSLFNENNSLLNETKYLISPEITIDISLWSQIKKNMQLAFPLLKSF
jgi:hypothetical protein